MGSNLLGVVEEGTLAAHTGCAQGELVLESRPPPVTTEASDHTGRGPKRRTATMPSTPTASTASPNADAPAKCRSWPGSTAWAQRVKCSRTAVASWENR